MGTHDYKKTAILYNEFESQVLESILKERNIPHLLTSYYDTAFDGLYQTQRGWGHVSAPETFSDEILEILSDLRKEASAMADEAEDPPISGGDE